jgi:hypothetical protein
MPKMLRQKERKKENSAWLVKERTRITGCRQVSRFLMHHCWLTMVTSLVNLCVSASFAFLIVNPFFVLLNKLGLVLVAT